MAISNITRRDTLVGAAAALGASAATATSSLGAQKDDRHLVALWSEYVKALVSHSAARERYEIAVRTARDEVRCEIEAIDARGMLERNSPRPNAPNPEVHVKHVELTKTQIETLGAIVSVMLRSEDREQADISVRAKQEKERLRDEADKRCNVDVLDEQLDRQYEALVHIEQCILDAKAYTVTGAAIKLSLAAMRARDGAFAGNELLAGYEALLEVAGIEDFAATATEINPCAEAHGTLSPYLAG